MNSGGERRRRSGKKLRTKPAELGFERLEDRLALTVVINEFLAENDTGIRDVAGHRHDWIELKNTGAVAENIAGWYLTDSAVNLTKFQIPSAGALATLDPGEILLVYASGNNGEIGWLGSELHTNFQLSQEPGYLGLVRANGTTIEHEFNLYPQQDADVSYGAGVGIGSTTTETLLSSGSASSGDGSPVQFRPFTGPNADVDDFWLDGDYVATAGAGWSNATNGLGFGYGSTEYQDSTVSLGGQIGAYVRMPFNVTNQAELTSMNLELRVDNAYILFLNGREVQRERLQTDFKIGNDWEMNARQNLPNSTITGSPSVIDLTPWLQTIEEGDNVLAIYAANHTSDTGDFLVHAELTAERAIGSVVDSFMVTPTPGMENGAGYTGVIGDTNFSHDRGFYDAPFDLVISTAEPGTTIRYTTDGSMPTLTNGITYSGPITIDPATLSYTNAGVVTIRAAAFKSGFYSTNVDTQTFVFLDEVLSQDATGVPSTFNWGKNGPDWSMNQSIVTAVGVNNLKDDLQSIPTMSLVTDWEEFWGISGGTSDERGIYPQSEGWRDKSEEIASSLEYFTADGSEEFQIDAAVEIQGHSSTLRWRTDKLSLQVKFKQPYDTSLESDTLLVNSAVDGQNAATQFDTLVLDAQYNYTWLHDNNQQHKVAKYINDQVVADYINLAGGDSPHGRWVHLYVNGMYWGIYNAHERPDDSFADQYFGGSEDDYFAVKAFDGVGSHPEQYLQVDGGLHGEEAYADFLDEVNDSLANSVEYAQVESILDIDAFIDYMIVHYYAGNWDWGQDNWYATFNHVEPDGKWRFHSWDQEHAFPTDDNLIYGEDDFDETYDSTTKNDAYGPTGIHQDLMANDEYRLQFSDRVQELMQNGGLLTPAAAAAVWQARIDELSGAINAEAARWGDSKGDEDGGDWLANVNGILTDFFPVRTSITLADFENHDWLVDLNAPTFNQYGGTVMSGFDLVMTNPNGGGTIYYTLDGSDPRLQGGGLSALAIAYSGPIDITAGTQVKARVFNSAIAGTANDWSPLVDKTFVLAESFPLRIVELHYNPAGPEEVTEFIELLNYGSETISLNGVEIGGFAGTPYAFQSGQTLNAGERIVVARNPADFTAFYGGGINLATGPGYADANLSNGGELVTLRGPVGELLQAFVYGDSGVAGWPASADGDGPSLEYIGPLAGTEDPTATSPLDPFDDPANWQASAVSGGTPGTGPTSQPDDADFNNDGEISGLDFLAWQRNFPITSGANFDQGDADHNGTVDAVDLSIWETQYGTPPSLAAALSAGEEPAMVAALSEPVATNSDLVALAAVQSGPGPADSASRDVVLAEDVVDQLFVNKNSDEPVVGHTYEQTPQDEALASSLDDDSDEAATEDLLTLLDEELV